jgi:hypothetical protein
MTKDENKTYIQTQISYKYILGGWIVSDWITPESIKEVKELAKEMDIIHINDDGKSFRIERKIK